MGHQIIEDVPAGNKEGPVSAAVSRLSFFIDGAHTPESMASCGQWFSEASTAAAQTVADASTTNEGASTKDPGSHQSDLQRVLLFHCMKV